MKPLLNKLLFFVALIFQMLNSNAQTINPPIYSTDWVIKDMESKGDTLFVGGWFEHAGKYSQGIALFTTTSDQPNPNLAKMDEEVIASTADGNGGYYILTNYEMKHILPNLSFDASFSIPVITTWVRERKILYHNGVVYVSGDTVGGKTSLMAFDAATQQPLSTLPAVNGRVTNMRIFGNHLYILGNFGIVGNLQREKAAQIDLSNHSVTGWQLQPDTCFDINGWFACKDIVEHGNKVIIGGNFSCVVNNTQTIYHALVADATTGAVTQSWIPDCGLFGCATDEMYWAADIEVMALQGNTLYTYSWGTFDTRLTAFDISNGLSFLWSRYFNGIAGAYELVATPNAVFIGGNFFEDIYQINIPNDNVQDIEAPVRNAIKLNAATGAIENWHPDPIGLINSEVFSMALSNNDLLLTGRFSHVNGLDRKGLYAIHTVTGQVLPYQLQYNHVHEVNTMKRIGDTLYLAGHFDNDIFDSVESTVVALDISTGQEITTNIPYVGTAYKMEIAGQYIFLAGGVHDTSSTPTQSELIAIDRYTGQIINWNANPDWDVTALHTTGNELYVGGNFTTISGQSRNGAAAYDLNNLSLLSWQSSVSGDIRTIKSDDSLIYLGGYIQWSGTTLIDNFAAVKKTDGSVVKYAVYQQDPVDINDLIIKNNRLIAGGFSYDSCANPAIYKGDTLLNKTNDICINVSGENQTIYAMELIGNNLYYAGSFLRTHDSLMGSNIGRISFPAGYFNDSVTHSKTVTAQKINIFPNPTNGYIYIQTRDNLINEILSMDGRIVFAKNNKKVIDLSHLPAGMYILHLYNKEGVKVQSEKIVKQ